MQAGRTDLAVEVAASPCGAGVNSQERMEEGVPVRVVDIVTEAAARRLGKPVGRYVTLELGPVQRRERTVFQRFVRVLGRELGEMIPKGEGPVLVACLGNRAVTPDAIGPLTHQHLLITRHLEELAPEFAAHFQPVAAVGTGVLGTTGVESGDVIAAVAGHIRPRCVIAVDALAAKGLERLCATVQLCDAGIAPGSGVGNARKALDRATLGVPVIAVGVPTVVDAATLAHDIWDEAGAPGVEPPIVRDGAAGLFVTPRDIDVRVHECAKLLGYGIDLALQPGLSVEEIEGLVG